MEKFQVLISNIVMSILIGRVLAKMTRSNKSITSNLGSHNRACMKDAMMIKIKIMTTKCKRILIIVTLIRLATKKKVSII